VLVCHCISVLLISMFASRLSLYLRIPTLCSCYLWNGLHGYYFTCAWQLYFSASVLTACPSPALG